MCNAESQVSREEKSKLGAKCEMVEPATRLYTPPVKSLELSSPEVRGLTARKERPKVRGVRGTKS